MKKTFLILICALLLTVLLMPCTFAAKAAEIEAAAAGQTAAPAPEPETQNMSAVKLMVTGFELENNYVVPGKEAKLKITIKNTNSYKSARNIKLSLKDAENRLVPDGMGTEYISYIGEGAEYVWETKITALKTAEEGRAKLIFEAEYEDVYYSSFSSSDEIPVEIRQPVSLDIENAVLPFKVCEGEIFSQSINCINSGKAEIRNIKIKADLKGFKDGGVTFVGTLLPGENKEGVLNLNPEPEKLGEISGKINISYEDIYGKSYSQNFDVKTLVEEKIELTVDTEEEETKYPLWWAFALAGLVLGGGVGCAVPIIIHSSKQRKLDEERL